MSRLGISAWTAALLAVVVVMLAPQRAAAQTILRDAEIEKELRTWSNPIFTAAGLDPSHIEIILVQDPTLNAFVADGQKLHLHSGLILAADNPNQLIGVIAHETGHIAGGHLARSDEAISAAMRPAYVSIGLGILAMAAGAPDAGAALIAGSQQFAMASYLGFSRTQESSADQAAFTYLTATHQSGEGLESFFDKFRVQEVLSDSRRDPFFRSHPLSSERIEALRMKVDASPYKTATDSAESIHALKMMQAKLRGFIDPPQQTFWKYPDTDQSEPARYARAIAAYRIPDLRRAVKETEALIADEPNNPYFEELLGQIYFENGKIQEAVDHHRKSLLLSPNQPLLQVNLARALNALETPESTKEAINLLQAAIAGDADNGFAWRELAIAYERSGDLPMAQLATAESAYTIGDYVRAHEFAQRAQKKLPPASHAWRRAGDIILIAEPAAQALMKNGRRRGG
ncbi:MAG: M48 family metalloprotease [Caulobacterales bacterium]